MGLASALADYGANIARAQGYISNAHARDASGNFVTPADHRAFIVDAAFLRMFIAWETFLESAFVAYTLGESSLGGRAPVRFVSPPNEHHSKLLLLGTQKYVDWANPEIVRKLASNCFQNGEPLGQVVSGIQGDLFDLRTIRNAAAHLTATTAQPLDGVASRKLGVMTSGATVSSLVLSIDPNGNGTDTILDSYLTTLDAAANAIVHWP
jgi:hypothetical protein